MNKTIWILSDGKAGHLSQTRGLAGALIAQTGGQSYEIDLAGKCFFGKLKTIWKQRSASSSKASAYVKTSTYAKAPADKTAHKTVAMEVREQPPSPRLRRPGGGDDAKAGVPDFIIAAGHGMHLPLLLCGWLLKKAKTVVCMKPSFPMRCFDFCIVPRHDLTLDVLANPPSHIIPTLGALHGVHPSPASPKTFILILIGGPSKEYGWDGKQVIEQLKAVSSGQPPSPRLRRPGGAEDGDQRSEDGSKERFLLTTSRRTPAGFVDVLRKECPSIDVVPAEETPRGWVAEKLAGATAVWVTRDSVSMIYEALGSGAPVGLLNMPALLPDGMKKSRVAKGIAMLEADGWVTPFDTWKETGILKSKGALVEVDRVANVLCISCN